MTPEIAVIVQRASARRQVLEGLLDALPGEYWEQRAPGDSWSVRNHVEHLATVDRPLVSLLEDAHRGATECWLGGPGAGALLDAREAGMVALAGVEARELRLLLRRERAAVESALAALPPSACDCTVRIAGAIGSGGEPAAWPLRTYLASWAEHDGLHEAAIRVAIAAPPDLATVMLLRAARSG